MAYCPRSLVIARHGSVVKGEVVDAAVVDAAVVDAAVVVDQFLRHDKLDQ
jgi:hypothetical protein